MPVLDKTFLDLVTREKFIPTLRNQLYGDTPLFNRMIKNGQKKTMSGTSLSWREVIKKHEAKGLWSGYQILASQPINPVGTFTDVIAQYYATLSISEEEKIKNSGNKEKLLDILTLQTENARSTFYEDMCNALFGDGAEIGSLPQLEGLQKMISASNTYAGYLRTTAANAFWRSTVDATGHTLLNLKDSTSISYLPSIMRKNRSAASFAKNSPNLIVMTSDEFNLYQDIAGAHNLRIDNAAADLGFQGVSFAPNSVIIEDKFCTANYMYFLTTDDFELYVYPEADFSMRSGGWIEGQNQLAASTQIIWMGQIICRVPKQQAVCTSVGAS